MSLLVVNIKQEVIHKGWTFLFTLEHLTLQLNLLN